MSTMRCGFESNSCWSMAAMYFRYSFELRSVEHRCSLMKQAVTADSYKAKMLLPVPVSLMLMFR